MYRPIQSSRSPPFSGRGTIVFFSLAYFLSVSGWGDGRNGAGAGTYVLFVFVECETLSFSLSLCLSVSSSGFRMFSVVSFLDLKNPLLPHSWAVVRQDEHPIHKYASRVEFFCLFLVCLSYPHRFFSLQFCLWEEVWSTDTNALYWKHFSLLFLTCWSFFLPAYPPVLKTKTNKQTKRICPRYDTWDVSSDFSVPRCGGSLVQRWVHVHKLVFRWFSLVLQVCRRRWRRKMVWNDSVLLFFFEELFI